MEQSLTDSDISLSPSQLLERLQLLRQLQVLQRGKLQKQRLDYVDSPQTSSSITEIVSKFSNSTSYNTFMSLLQSSENATPQQSKSKVKETDLIDGVSILNTSHESEQRSPKHNLNRQSLSSKTSESSKNTSKESHNKVKKVIELDEMPILSPKKDFEALILEKLKNGVPKDMESKKVNKDNVFNKKKPFLRRGQGMSRFGIRKDDLVIQTTQSLPWKKGVETRTTVNKKTNTLKENTVTQPVHVQKISPVKNTEERDVENQVQKKPDVLKTQTNPNAVQITITPPVHDVNTCKNTSIPPKKPLLVGKHPLQANKGKTWASILSKEQDDFLRQLKQSDYYKNFESPTKSETSEAGVDSNFNKLQQQRELAEQNMFELLERKVSNDSFSLENSFFNKFLKRAQLECSGESTPLIMQKCLSEKPGLLGIYPGLKKKACEDTHSDAGTCSSEYTDCDQETCCSESSCCSCKTVEDTTCQLNKHPETCNNDYKHEKENSKKVHSKKQKAEVCENQRQSDINTETEAIKTNMAEMNAKLVATSDLLKERLRELEDEIETFRKENANLTKMREEVDLERQKFYEEKSAFEQKFNEDKILSEYYLAEEKEKLVKQKQVYEKYVREMRGRLNKKEKDEVLNLKADISNLKEEIRLKDAKSTSNIARLRNQLKIMEKEKKDLQDEVEKLKKENRRIQHSNEVSRRLTNIKYLEEINKKLSNMTSKDTQSVVPVDKNTKYKAFEIERQSRKRTVQSASSMRTRAKSVPNLNVTSKYAKYFSQRDSMSQMDRMKGFHTEKYTYASDDDDNNADKNDNISLNSINSDSTHDNISANEEENNLERIYMERFKEISSQNSKTSLNSSDNSNSQPNDFFLTKSGSNSNLKRDSKSPRTASPDSITAPDAQPKSPISVISHRSTYTRTSENISSLSGLSTARTKSPVSILSNRFSRSPNNPDVQKYTEPTSKTSLTKTTLNPTELRKPDGSKELRFPNGNVKYISADGKYSKFVYYNGDVKENFYSEGRIKYYYAETKTYHTTHPDGMEVLEFSDGQVEKRYKDGSSEIRLPNGSVRYHDPKNPHVREEWRFPDGTRMTKSATGEQRVQFSNGQVEVHAKDHKRREFPDGTVKLVYGDGSAETRYASGRVRLKDRHGRLLMDSAQAQR